MGPAPRVQFEANQARSILDSGNLLPDLCRANLPYESSYTNRVAVHVRLSRRCITRRGAIAVNLIDPCGGLTPARSLIKSEVNERLADASRDDRLPQLQMHL